MYNMIAAKIPNDPNKKTLYKIEYVISNYVFDIEISRAFLNVFFSK